MTKPPVDNMNYPTYLWQLYTDKTGTQFQTLVGALSSGGEWGVRVWRIPPGGKPELVHFLKDGNGQLMVDAMTKQLLFLQTDANRRPSYLPIAGYIHPVDCPDSDVVSIDEQQVALLKQMIATTNSIAYRADTTAKDASAQVVVLNQIVADLQDKVIALQRMMLTHQQVEDIVWAKIRDMNYLYRLAFISYPTQSIDPDIRAYVSDLCFLIRKVN